jgi:catechol 2,3-dioxygenase-like lactoylglutathione lyase family enzyme
MGVIRGMYRFPGARPGLQSTLCVRSAERPDVEQEHSGRLIMQQLVTPQLRSTNWIRTKAFYVDGLGFTVDWEHQFEPSLPTFAQVTLDGRSLFLTEHTGDCQPGGAAYIVVDDVDALYEAVRSRGVRVWEAPEEAPWGVREMCIIDPDGNRLRFANARQQSD